MAENNDYKCPSQEGRHHRLVIRESDYTIKDLPDRLLPENSISRLGIDNVADDALLAVILTGNCKVNRIDLARGLLKNFGSLTALRCSSIDELAGVDGMTERQARALMAALEIGRRLQQESIPLKPRVRTPGDVAALLKEEARRLDTERFWVLPLDARNCLMVEQPLDITRGIADASLVHPREVFRECIRLGACAVVVAHNHPTNDTSPSADDIRISKTLCEAGRVIDLKLLDSLIIGRDGSVRSLREEGICQF